MDKKLEKAIKELKKTCSAANFDTMINSIVEMAKDSVKREALVFVERDEKNEQIKQSAYEITRGKDTIVYKIRGMQLVITPDLNIYHTPYDYLLRVGSNYDNATDEEKDTYDKLIVPATIIPQIPTFAFSSPEWLSKYLDTTNFLFEESIKEGENADLIQETEEDLEANRKFEEEMMMIETLKGEDNA